MTTYTLQQPQKGMIKYSDWKRHWWLLSLVYPLTPIITIWFYLQSFNQWVLLVPLLIGFVLIPFLDFALGSDKTNPPEEIVPQLDQDSYYQKLTYLAIPLHFASLLVAIWFIGSYPLDPGFYLGFAVMVGIFSGLAINTAHEMGHKNTKMARLWSRITLAVCGYGHFCIEHNLGHHRDVSTPEDPASSRMGESIYRFSLREIPGAAKRGWQAERERLARRGHGFWSLHNHVLQSYALTLAIQGGAVVWFGWVVVPFLLIHNVEAWFQLTSANYIEHYGLLRARKENGKYERCQPHHSWNANHIFSNLILFQLERHSDHHANPSRPYQSLRSFENLPELPSGYFAMYLVAYFPRWWYRVMDKRLLAIPHINGDFSKINLDPKNAERLKAKYADFQPAQA
ncbi:MAG: alkane 1-monooxygenase [Gammaproteobacteria bacterium]|nr:alkane 1-monooxygenase [Gammaproteobacteria bacterium]